ncbi:hypothetical protein [Leptospira sarikeiensis]|uniref:Uncharacterized protein n=1 Tax=Leptospira sarikeiensis TaxID=2484943 RepID=A0A4R9KAC0_9LEPT|nr:hypothetical protein [Leptospira sarikeiensis]TGL62966.1 hypothetical protein EHQ64_07265 [Leptospira sarikeiensis]
MSKNLNISSFVFVLFLTTLNHVDCKEKGEKNLKEAENRNLQGVEALQKDPQKAIHKFRTELWEFV